MSIRSAFGFKPFCLLRLFQRFDKLYSCHVQGDALDIECGNLNTRNRHEVQEYISTINSGNAFYFSVPKLLSFRLLSKILTNSTYRTKIVALVSCGCESGL
jgi:hypothetical protein